MSSKVERMVVMRRRLLANNLLGLIVWQAASLTNELLSPHHPLHGPMALISIGGALYWMTCMWRITEMQKQLKGDVATERAMEDELVRMNRLRAALYALVSVSTVLALLIGILALLPNLLSGITVAEVGLLVGTGTFIGAFLYLDGKEG